MGVGEMEVGETGVGEMGVGEMVSRRNGDKPLKMKPFPFR